MPDTCVYICADALEDTCVHGVLYAPAMTGIPGHLQGAEPGADAGDPGPAAAADHPPPVPSPEAGAGHAGAPHETILMDDNSAAWIKVNSNSNKKACVHFNRDGG